MATVTCYVTLVDEDNTPLINYGIDWSYSIDNGVTWVKFDHTFTNSSGQATTHKDIVMDTQFYAEYAGSQFYYPAHDRKSSTQGQTGISPDVETLGKSEGFSTFLDGTGIWSHGAGCLANDCGLQLGFWVWNKNKAKWMRGGWEVP
jgi:hypothetical protein